MTLKVKKFTDEKFPALGGYFMCTNDWGVIDTETNKWVTFDGNGPYVPRGGRKAALEVATKCNPQELNYISTI